MFKTGDNGFQVFFSAVVLLGGFATAHAGLVFVNESDGTHDPVFYIDSGDASTDFIDLEFGTTLDAKLRYEIANDQFALNRDLDLGGNEIQNASFEKLAVAPICDGTTIGRFYYNTTDTLTYSCDGTTWSPLENVINASIALPVVQARRTTVFALLNSYEDVDLDTTDAENDVTTLDHDDTLRDRVNIGSTGLYQIIYGYTAGGSATATHEARARVRLNDTAVLEGSESVNRNFQQEFSTTSASFYATLSAGDFITLQLFRDGTVDETQDEIFLSVVKLEGIKGDKGDQGLPGSVGLGTNENVFTLDLDDTGGDISLVFGSTLNEALTWDDTNGQFVLSDDLVVSGAFGFAGALTVGGVAGTTGQVLTSQGPGLAPIWQSVSGGGASASVFYAYDGTGLVFIDGTEQTLNIDTPVVTDANYALAADQVTVTDAGLYRIKVELGLDGQDAGGSQRATVQLRLQEGGANINGGFAVCYIRETEDNTCSLEVFHTLTGGEVLRARVVREGGTSDVRTKTNGSRFLIEKIR